MMKFKRQKSGRLRGLTLIEVLVVIGCLILLVMVLLPALARAKSKAQCATCQNHLMQIGLAFRIWEGDHGNHYPMAVSTNKGGTMEWGPGNDMFRHYQVMSNQLNNPAIMVCPSDNRKEASDFASFSNTNLSYFVGLDADETMPHMALAGDRNLVTNGIAVNAGLTTITPTIAVTWTITIHKTMGNVGLADGSVQQFSNAGIQQFFSRTGTNVNRLAVP